MSPIRISRESSFIVHKDKFDRIIGFHLNPDDVSDLNISSNIPPKQASDDKTCSYKIPTCAEEITITGVPSLIIVSGEEGTSGKSSLIYYKAEPVDIEKAVKKEEDGDCVGFVSSDESYKGSPICGKCVCISSCYDETNLDGRHNLMI